MISLWFKRKDMNQIVLSVAHDVRVFVDCSLSLCADIFIHLYTQ